MNGSNGMGATGPDPLKRIDGTGVSGKPKEAAPNEGAAFRALLDALQTRADELSQQSESVARPSDLSEAVGHARESLEEALDVHDRLLEAFLQARQQRAVGPEDGER